MVLCSTCLFAYISWDTSQLLTVFCAAWFAALLGYLLYTRRFFPRDEQAGRELSLEHP